MICDFQKVRTWLANEVKTVRTVADGDPPPVVEVKVTERSGQWNFRTVCAQIHAEALKERMGAGDDDDDIDGDDGSSTNQTAAARLLLYQSSLMEVWNDLSDTEQKTIQETAKEWNRRGCPPHIQQRCVPGFRTSSSPD
jgi:hypothetical protein